MSRAVMKADADVLNHLMRTGRDKRPQNVIMRPTGLHDSISWARLF
jgi:hypothetical protein